MTDHVSRAGIEVDRALAAFVENEVLAPLGHAPDRFWEGFARLLATFVPRNRALLARRDDLQAQIDAWHGENAGKPHDAAAYRAFSKIGRAHV